MLETFDTGLTLEVFPWPRAQSFVNARRHQRYTIVQISSTDNSEQNCRAEPKRSSPTSYCLTAFDLKVSPSLLFLRHELLALSIRWLSARRGVVYATGAVGIGISTSDRTIPSRLIKSNSWKCFRASRYRGKPLDRSRAGRGRPCGGTIKVLTSVTAVKPKRAF